MLTALALLALTASDGAVSYFAAFEGLPDAAATDAGWLEPICKVADGRIPAPEGGWLHLGPGCFLPTPACLEKGKRAADLETELEQLRGAPHDFSFRELFKAAWVGFGLGAVSALFGLGFACWSVTGSVICRR
jgi:hypothetical protein